MKTEILFIGQRITDKGDWVTSGSIKQEETEAGLKVYLLYNADWIEVIPESVGRFTGITDKNGEKIFEGDIVISPRGTQGFVEWQKSECAYLVNIGDDWQTMDDCIYKVIGNIHDNK